MHYALCDEKDKKPMAMKLVCAGKDERVVGLHVIGIFADEVRACNFSRARSWHRSRVALLTGCSRDVLTRYAPSRAPLA